MERRGGGAPAELRVRWWVTVAALSSRLLHLSYRRRILDPLYALRRREGAADRCVYAMWHSHIWQLLPVFRGHGLSVLVSRHSDGEIVARVLRAHGHGVVRGSSTEGGAVALRGLLSAARTSDGDLAVIIDGPRGPPRQVKEGVLYVASRSGLPVVPVCARTGEGFDALTRAMRAPVRSSATLGDPTAAQDAADWADEVVAGSVGGDHAVGAATDSLTDRPCRRSRPSTCPC